MKATIIDHRYMTWRERLRHPFREFVTIWKLDNGDVFQVFTAIEGGSWTSLLLEEKLVGTNKRLQRSIGTEKELTLVTDSTKGEKP